jgi:hypothetical protein
MPAINEMSVIQKMEWAHQTILSLYPRDSVPELTVDPNADIRKHVETILKDLGYRIARWGIPQSVAFLMAKAAFHNKKPSARMKANQWVLRALFSTGRLEECSEYFNWISGEQALDPRKNENLIVSIGWLTNFCVSIRLIRDITCPKLENIQ